MAINDGKTGVEIAKRNLFMFTKRQCKRNGRIWGEALLKAVENNPEIKFRGIPDILSYEDKISIVRDGFNVYLKERNLSGM